MHIELGDEIPHALTMNMWTDSDLIRWNDFEGIKADWFGTNTERMILNRPGTLFTSPVQAAVVTAGTDTAEKILEISGVTIATPEIDPAICGGCATPQTKGTMTFKVTVTLDAVSSMDADVSVGSTFSPGPIRHEGTSTLQVLAGAIDVVSFEPDPSNQNIKTFVVKVPYILKMVSPSGGPAFDFDTIKIPFRLTGNPTILITDTTGVTGDHSPINLTTLQEMKAQWFHYGVIGHWLGVPCGPTGVAELNGNDFAMGLGCGIGPTEDLIKNNDFDAFLDVPYSSGSPETLENPETTFGTGQRPTSGYNTQIAGTWVHEIGHNFGFDHGGPQFELLREDILNGLDDDGDGFIDEVDGKVTQGTPFTDSVINCKPNYPSVMSYSRQLPTYLGGAGFSPNFSEGLLADIDEKFLSELTLIQYPRVPTPVIDAQSGSPAYSPLKIVVGHPGESPRTSVQPATSGLTAVGTQIDWTGDDDYATPNFGTFDDVAPGTVPGSFDVNNLGIAGACAASLGQVYSDRDDIHNINFNFRGAGGSDFDGHPSDIATPEIDFSIVQTGSAQGNWYDGALRYHTIHATGDGADGEDPVNGVDDDGDGLIDEDTTADGIDDEANFAQLGDVVNLSFQHFTCPPIPPTGAIVEECIDTHHLVMQAGYYEDPANDETGQAAVGNEITLSVVLDAVGIPPQLFAVIQKIEHIFPGSEGFTSYEKTIPLGFHELDDGGTPGDPTDDNFIYHLNWNTNDVIADSAGPGKYAIFVVDGNDNVLVDNNEVDGQPIYQLKYAVPEHDLVDNTTEVAPPDGNADDSFDLATIIVTLVEVLP